MLNELNHVIDYIEDHLTDDLSPAGVIRKQRHRNFASDASGFSSFNLKMLGMPVMFALV